MRPFCFAWIDSNRASRASMAWARIRSDCDVALVDATRSRSRSGARFQESLCPVTASDRARSMSASSSPEAAVAPALTAGGGAAGVERSNTLVPRGNQPDRSFVMPPAGSCSAVCVAASNSATACVTALPASRIASTAAPAAASPAASAAVAGSGTGASAGGSARSSARAQRNSPEGGSIRTQAAA